jgi:hypothetical protein
MRPWLLALALAIFGPPAAAQTVRLNSALSVSSGSYLFAERTTTWALTTGLTVGGDEVSLRASLPFYLQNTTLVAGSGIGRIPTGGSSGGAVGDSGAARKGRGDGRGDSHLDQQHSRSTVEVPGSAVTGYEAAAGDPEVAITWHALRSGSTGVALGAAVKVPVADTSTFGTGQWDAGAMLSLSRSLDRGVFLGADLAYWHLGDLPDLELRDPVSGTVSVSYLGGSGWGGSLVGFAATSVVDGFDGPASIGAALTRVSSGGSSWNLMSLVGLTETSPDVTVGLSWSVRVSR